MFVSTCVTKWKTPTIDRQLRNSFAYKITIFISQSAFSAAEQLISHYRHVRDSRKKKDSFCSSSIFHISIIL